MAEAETDRAPGGDAPGQDNKTAAVAPAGTNTAPTIEAIHANVGWANTYRLELIKLVMTLAAGVLAFTVSFRPSLTTVDEPRLMWIGWIGLGLSIVGGMIHMQGWDRFYISYRDHDWRLEKPEGKAARSLINQWRRFGMLLQYLGFAAGIIAIAIFSALNIGNVAPPTH